MMRPNADSRQPESQTARRPKPKLLLGIVTGVIVLVTAAAVLWKGQHLWFVVAEAGGHVGAIPVASLGAADEIPRAWQSVTVGGQSLRVPPALLRTIEASAGGVLFDDGAGRKMLVLFPSSNQQQHEAFVAYVESLPRSVPRRETVVRTLIYQATPAQFWWSMTNAELRTLRWCLNLKALNCDPTEAAYVREEADWDGLLEKVVHQNSGSFWWCSRDGTRAGAMIFESKASQSDVDWIRQVCLSLSPGTKTYSDPVPAGVAEAEVDRLRKSHGESSRVRDPETRPVLGK